MATRAALPSAAAAHVAPAARLDRPAAAPQSRLAPARSLGSAPVERPRRSAKARAAFIVAAAAAEPPPALAPVDTLPPPEVFIDNLSDPLATIITVRFGNLLGELLDTTQALKNLGLDITRAELKEESNKNRFYVTDAATSEKIVLSERLEQIRATIIKNMLQYHPEAATAGLAMHLNARKVTEKLESPLGARIRPAIEGTQISMSSSASGSRSELTLTTPDRPGLLVDIVRVLKDCSLNVVSAKIETTGSMAKDTFFVTYRGRALNPPMTELVTNALTYYLTLAEIEATESY